jgi:hypothetical protein
MVLMLRTVRSGRFRRQDDVRLLLKEEARPELLLRTQRKAVRGADVRGAPELHGGVGRRRCGTDVPTEETS